MMQPTPRQAVQKKPATRAASFGVFKDLNLALNGYWLKEDQQIIVEVPIFPHGYYPKWGAPEHEIKQNIVYRAVTVPSLSELRQHGIEIFKAFFVAGIGVHPRHIKNWNFFRSEFPATVKSLAKTHNTLFILPANDIPSGRLIRKEVLNLWRQLFTPLFIKGHHYTSGRMTMFMAAPPNSLTKMKLALNLEQEHPKEDNLQEWYPSVGEPRQSRKRGPKARFNTRQLELVKELADATSERMKEQLLPIVATKLDIPPNTKAAAELEDYLTSPETTREIIRETQFGKDEGAVRRWVKRRMIPKLKEIVATEGAAVAERTLRSLVSYAFELTISTVIEHMFTRLKKTKRGDKVLKRFGWTPEGSYTGSFGTGRITHTPEGAEKKAVAGMSDAEKEELMVQLLLKGME